MSEEIEQMPLMNTFQKAARLQLQLIQKNKRINQLMEEYEKMEDEYGVLLSKLPPNWKHLDKHGLLSLEGV